MQKLTYVQLRQLAELHSRKDRHEQGLFLIEGEKTIFEAIKAGHPINKLIMTEEFAAKKGQFLSTLTLSADKWYLTPGNEIKRLSSMVTPPEIMAVVEVAEVRLDSLYGEPVIVAFDDIADPGNLGTMIRTADWFGIRGVILSPQTVDPYNEKVVRSAMGSLFHVKLFQSTHFAEDLAVVQKSGYKIVMADSKGGILVTRKKDKVCLVMGSESHGISTEVKRLADTVFTIPGKGQAESLNVGVSFGIILHHLNP